MFTLLVLSTSISCDITCDNRVPIGIFRGLLVGYMYTHTLVRNRVTIDTQYYPIVFPLFTLLVRFVHQ